MVFSFDEINALYEGKYKRKSIPYEQYFGDMDLSEEQKEKRVLLAEKIEEVILFLFILFDVYEEYGEIEESIEFIVYSIKQKYMDAIKDFFALEDYVEESVEELETDEKEPKQKEEDALWKYIKEHTEDFIEDYIKTTLKHKNEPYYTSEDRAILTSENEANSISNATEFIEAALKNGFTKKMWNTEKDELVRHSHALVEGVVLDINTPFVVGDSLMLFPKDTSYDASEQEIANCRCTMTYF